MPDVLKPAGLDLLLRCRLIIARVGETLSLAKIYIRAATLLRKFILDNGFKLKGAELG